MRLLLPLGLAALTLALYAGRLSAPFVFDDRPSIIENASIRSLHVPDSLFAARGTPTAGRPLVNFSFALNYAASRLEPFGYHAVNLCIHFACSWLVFLCLARLFAAEGNPERLRRQATGLAAVTAVLFAVHPIAVEIVLYTTQRSEGLVTLFFLLTCYAFLRNAGGQGGAGSVLLAGASAVAGALSKASIVVVIPLLLLCDRTFYAGSFAKALRMRARLYAAVLVSYVPLVALESTHPRADSTSFWDPAYLLAQGRYVLGYLSSVFWPRLALDHGDYRPNLAVGALPFALALACVVLACAVLVVTHPRLGFVGAWVFALLAPTSSLIAIHTEVAADRRMYLPMVALLAAAVAGVGAALSLLAERRAWSNRARQAAASACCALVALVFFVQSAERTDAFASEVGFWERALLETPLNPRAAYNLGEAYQRAGRRDDAIQAYQAALYRRPDYTSAHSNLSSLLMQLGRSDEGLFHARRAVEVGGAAPTHYNYALGLLSIGQTAKARAELERSVALDPNYAEAHLNLGALLMSLGETTGGLQHLERGVALRPDAQALHNYATALAKVGRQSEAQIQLERARRLQPQ